MSIHKMRAYDDDMFALMDALSALARTLLRTDQKFNILAAAWLADIFYDQGFEKEVWDNPAEALKWINDLPGVATELVLDILAEKGY